MLAFSHPLHKNALVDSFLREGFVILLEVQVTWDEVFFWEQLVDVVVT